MEASANPLILIVDDDQEIRLVLRFLLEDHGYRVEEAARGMAALDHLRAATEPMIVLLDQLMPHMHGEEVLQALAQEPPNALASRHSFILMTASNKSSELQQRLDQFPQIQTRLLIKPFELDVLLDAVRQAVEAVYALQPVAPPLDVAAE